MTLAQIAAWCGKNALWRWVLLSNLASYVSILSLTPLFFVNGTAFGLTRHAWWLFAIPPACFAWDRLTVVLRNASARESGSLSLPTLTVREGTVFVIWGAVLLSILDWTLSLPGRTGGPATLPGVIPVLSVMTGGISVARVQTHNRVLGYIGVVAALWPVPLIPAAGMECFYAYTMPVGLAALLLLSWRSMEGADPSDSVPRPDRGETVKRDEHHARAIW